MDIGLLPEFANHFITAAHTVLPFVQHGFDVCVNAGLNVWTGASHPDAMDSSDRNFHLAKISLASFGLGTSIATANIEGIAACAVTKAESLIALEKAGARVRQLNMGG